VSENLSKKSCEACREGVPVLSDIEINELMPQIPSWIVHEEDGLKRLVCSFAFSSYQDSLDFTNNIARLAEEEDHHPEIVLEWGNVTVSWWSHKIKGLHKNDFICASKTDDIFKAAN